MIILCETQRDRMKDGALFSADSAGLAEKGSIEIGHPLWHLLAFTFQEKKNEKAWMKIHILLPIIYTFVISLQPGQNIFHRKGCQDDRAINSWLYCWSETAFMGTEKDITGVSHSTVTPWWRDGVSPWCHVVMTPYRYDASGRDDHLPHLIKTRLLMQSYYAEFSWDCFRMNYWSSIRYYSPPFLPCHPQRIKALESEASVLDWPTFQLVLLLLVTVITRPTTLFLLLFL